MRWIDGKVLVAAVCGGASGGVSHGLIGFEVTELQRERERDEATKRKSKSD